MSASRLVLALVLASASLTVAAAAESEAEQKLHEQLKEATLGLRNAQDENAALTAKVTELTKQLADAQKQIEDLKNQAPAQPAASDQDLLAAQSALKESDDKIAQLQDALGKWQGAYTKAAEVARNRDAAALQAEAQLKRVSGTLDLCTKKNDGLVSLARDLLDKIQNRTFLSYVLEHEPVTQLYRVKLENLVQDYEDKLADGELPKPADAKSGP